MIRGSPALLAARSGSTLGCLHPSCSRRQHPANRSSLHGEKECEGEGAEPASPSQELWPLESPRQYSFSWMWTYIHAHPSPEVFPSQRHHLKGGTEGPAEQSDGLSCHAVPPLRRTACHQPHYLLRQSALLWDEQVQQALCHLQPGLLGNVLPCNTEHSLCFA